MTGWLETDQYIVPEGAGTGLTTILETSSLLQPHA